MHSKPRTLETPDKERLTAAEAALWCGVETDDWSAMVRAGLIPDGASKNRQGKVWSWKVVMGVEALLDHLLPLLGEAVKRKRSQKNGEGEA